MLKKLLAKFKRNKRKNCYLVKIGRVVSYSKAGLFSEMEMKENLLENEYVAKKKKDKNGFVYFMILEGDFAGQFVYASVKDVQESGDFFVHSAQQMFSVQSKYSIDKWENIEDSLNSVEDNQHYYEKMYK